MTQAVVGAVGGLLQAGLGVWVYAASPRSWVNRGFALFLFGQGLGDAVRSFVDEDRLEAGSTLDVAWFSSAEVVYAIASFFVAVTAFYYPGGRRISRFGAFTLAALALVSVVGAFADLERPWGTPGHDRSAAAVVGELAAAVLYNGQAFWALRVSRLVAVGDESQQKSARLVALGMIIYPLYNAARKVLPAVGLLPAEVSPVLRVAVPLIVSAAFVCSLIVLWRCIRPGPSGTWRLGPLIAAGLALALGLVAAYRLARPDVGLPPITYSLSNYILVALVGYGILRRDVFTLDVKVRFGLSKGTVAAIVVAVVFVVSEGAQNLFGEDKQWLGLAVGGLVVFAIAPIQRAADRLAERAVPVAAHPRTSGVLGTYREQVSLAWSDGRLTPKERRMLKSLRDSLGVDVAAAERVEDDVVKHREAKK